MNFDKILNKFDQVLITYSEKHPIHVENFQECLKIKIQRQKSSRIWTLKQMLTLLDVRPENQNVLISISTISIYQNPTISIFSFFGATPWWQCHKAMGMGPSAQSSSRTAWHQTVCAAAGRTSLKSKAAVRVLQWAEPHLKARLLWAIYVYVYIHTSLSFVLHLDAFG